MYLQVLDFKKYYLLGDPVWRIFEGKVGYINRSTSKLVSITVPVPVHELELQNYSQVQDQLKYLQVPS